MRLSRALIRGSACALGTCGAFAGVAMAQPPDGFEEIEAIIGLAVMSSVPVYFVLQASLAYAWSGGWRKAALLPLIAMVPVIAWSLRALSHASNLWPITVILL